jgi:hypothetical protein
MKYLAIVTTLVVFFGCASIYPPPVDPVCAKPEAAGSVICATAQKLGLTPEQLDAAFLDAALVGIGAKVIKADELRKAVNKAIVWVKDKDILTIQGLTAYLVTESTVDPALALLLSRRLGLINLPDLGVQPLTAYDRELVLAGLDHQLKQLAFF